MNGRNGNILEGYWRNRNKPDWTLVFALCGIIGTLLGALWVESEKKTDLKIENTHLKIRNEIQKQILEHQYAPNNQPPP